MKARVKRLLCVVAGAFGGIAATAGYSIIAEPVTILNPWNLDWDMRAPDERCKECRAADKALETAQSRRSWFSEFLNSPQYMGVQKQVRSSKRPSATRHLYLVRHGQFDLKGKTDVERVLTELGRKQAELSGKRLHEHGITWDRVHVSTMTRARETADLISRELAVEEREIPVQYDDLLREGAPQPPIPPSRNWRRPAHQWWQDSAKMEAAFRKYFHRAEPNQHFDTHELLVCHANIIRFFICRAIQLPLRAWLRFSLPHASVTHISIDPNGVVTLNSFGDSGHLEPTLVTTNH